MCIPRVRGMRRNSERGHVRTPKAQLLLVTLVVLGPKAALRLLRPRTEGTCACCSTDPCCVHPRTWVQGGFAVEPHAAVGSTRRQRLGVGQAFPSLPRVGSVWLAVVCIKKLQQVKGLNYCVKRVAVRAVRQRACARSAAGGLGCGVAARKSGRENVANTVQILALWRFSGLKSCVE